jgi:hypothetical protein
LGPQVLVEVEDRTFQALGPQAVAAIFTSLAARLGSLLARSAVGSLFGAISQAELEGPLEFVDWFQYYSPSVVARLPQSGLAVPPFTAVRWGRDGSCSCILGASPFEWLHGRVAVAVALGIALRPLTARNPKTGEPIVIPWS